MSTSGLDDDSMSGLSRGGGGSSRQLYQSAPYHVNIPVISNRSGSNSNLANEQQGSSSNNSPIASRQRRSLLSATGGLYRRFSTSFNEEHSSQRRRQTSQMLMRDAYGEANIRRRTSHQYGHVRPWQTRLFHNNHSVDSISQPLLHGLQFAPFHSVPSVIPTESTTTEPERVPLMEKSIFGLPLLEPEGAFALGWRRCMFLVDGFYILSIMPLFSSFGTVLGWNAISLIDFVVAILLLLDPFVKLNTKIIQVVNYQKIHVSDGFSIARFLASKYAFLADLVCALIFFPQFYVLFAPWVDAGNPRNIFIFWNIHNLRYLRGFFFFKHMFQSSFAYSLFDFDVGQLYVINVIYTCMTLCNIMACLWYSVAHQTIRRCHRDLLDGQAPAPAPGPSSPDLVQELEEWGGAAGILAGMFDCNGETWIERLNLQDKPQWLKYVKALYYALSTMTTVGYGDITPGTVSETAVTMMMELVGVLLFAFIVGNILNLLEKSAKTTRRFNLYREKMMGVQLWMNQRNLPHDTRKQIQEYYRDVWARKQDINDTAIFGELPIFLRYSVTRHVMETQEEQIWLFSHLPVPARNYLYSKLLPTDLLPGHELCIEGDEGAHMWILARGSIDQVSLKPDQPIITHDAPSLLGYNALLSHYIPRLKFRDYSLKSNTACQLWSLNVHTVLSIDNNFPGTLGIIMEQLMQHISTEIKHELQHAMRSRLVSSQHSTASGRFCSTTSDHHHAVPEWWSKYTNTLFNHSNGSPSLNSGMWNNSMSRQGQGSTEGNGGQMAAGTGADLQRTFARSGALTINEHQDVREQEEPSPRDEEGMSQSQHGLERRQQGTRWWLRGDSSKRTL